MKPPKASKSARFFSALIRTAYLPLELPPAITTRYFAEFCQNDFAFLKSQHSSLLKTTTNYETFTAPRAKSGRRNLALVHPLAQASLSLSITQHRKKIRDLLAKSKSSLYRTTEDLKNSYAFVGLDFSKRNALQAKILSEYPFVLNADISRFFYTIYTHSIVGPDTSRLIAELLLAGIESDKQFSLLLKDRLAFRLVDDFAIGFEREEDANRSLVALRKALWKFNLQLNEEKTSVSPITRHNAGEMGARSRSIPNLRRRR